MGMRKYMELLIEETSEDLEYFKKIILDLKERPYDFELCNEAFRVIHMTKGISKNRGFKNFVELTNGVEQVLQMLRCKEVEVSEESSELLFEYFNSLEECIENLCSTEEVNSFDSNVLAAKLKAVQKELCFTLPLKDENEKIIVREEVSRKNMVNEQNRFYIEFCDLPQNVISYAIQKRFNPLIIKVILKDGCTQKSARGFVVFNELTKFGEIMKSYPSVEAIENGNFKDEFELLYMTKWSKKTIRRELLKILEVDQVVVENIPLQVFE